MSFDTAIAGMHTSLFDAFGVDGGVVRGTDAAVPVRVVINRNTEKFGDYGQVTGRITTADFLSAQWIPKQGDVVTITGSGEVLKVEKKHADDGFVATAVIHG